MGRNDEYHELCNTTIRPFGTVAEADAYGNQLLKLRSWGACCYHSFVIQPLFKEANSFELSKAQIDFVLALETESVVSETS
jgi:hypothetical protein